jgi:o-succinylbenzoate---CoA ligase
MTIDSQLSSFLTEWNSDVPTISVCTSGSTGISKVMQVEKSRMIESAKSTCSFLNLKRGDTALLCMPLDYIAGKMMVVRSIVAGLRLITTEPSGHPLHDITEHIDLAAMVPLQIYNSLSVPSEFSVLSDISNTLIGGGAIDAHMEETLQIVKGQLWSTYGMTETLSHIALRAVNGPRRSPAYTPLKGISISLSPDSTLIIDAPKVAPAILTTNDIAKLNTDGTFTIIGRKDNIICSGGIKIQIEEVETILDSYLSMPFAITSMNDEKFGEAVTMLIKADYITDEITSAITHLPKYWQPKNIIFTDHIPTTGTGKKARAEIRAMVTAKSKKISLRKL